MLPKSDTTGRGIRDHGRDGRKEPMSLFSKVLLVVVLAAFSVVGAYRWAGRALGPTVEVNNPQRYVGRTSVLDFSVETPGGTIAGVEAVLEQGDTRISLFSLTDPREARVEQETHERIRIVRTFDLNDLPGATEGPAHLIVTAVRPVLYGLRQASTSRTHSLELRFEPPRLTVLSTQHYVNHGGAEMNRVPGDSKRRRVWRYCGQSNLSGVPSCRSRYYRGGRGDACRVLCPFT